MWCVLIGCYKLLNQTVLATGWSLPGFLCLLSLVCLCACLWGCCIIVKWSCISQLLLNKLYDFSHCVWHLLLILWMGLALVTKHIVSMCTKGDKGERLKRRLRRFQLNSKNAAFYYSHKALLLRHWSTYVQCQNYINMHHCVPWQ